VSPVVFARRPLPHAHVRGGGLIMNMGRPGSARLFDNADSLDNSCDASI
jgi:hypothetical protein